MSNEERDDIGDLPEIEELYPTPTEAELAVVTRVRATLDTAQSWCDVILRGDRPAPGVVDGLKATANTFLANLYKDAPELQIQ